MGLPDLAKTSLMREISPIYKILLHGKILYINLDRRFMALYYVSVISIILRK